MQRNARTAVKLDFVASVTKGGYDFNKKTVKVSGVKRALI